MGIRYKDHLSNIKLEKKTSELLSHENHLVFINETLINCFYPEVDRLGKSLYKICHEQETLVGGGWNFLYDSQTYHLNDPQPATPYEKANVPYLHESLHEAMDTYLIFMKTMRENRDIIKGYLRQLIMTAPSNIMIYYTVPDSFKKHLRYPAYQYPAALGPDSTQQAFIDKFNSTKSSQRALKVMAYLALQDRLFT